MKQDTLDGSEYLECGSSDEWETPQELFNSLNFEFEFTLDPCCTKETAKCEKYYTIEDNGLKKSWRGERVFMNPPYSEIPLWVQQTSLQMHFNECELVVALLPAWTDRIWFHDYIYDIPSKWRNKPTIRFLKGRVKFLLNGVVKTSPRFGSMVVIWK